MLKNDYTKRVYAQVEKRNPASLSLQEKLGMTRSDGLIVWMWKEP